MCLLAVVFSDKRVVSRAFLLPTCLMQVACVLFDAFIRSFSRLFLFILRILILKECFAIPVPAGKQTELT